MTAFRVPLLLVRWLLLSPELAALLAELG